MSEAEAEGFAGYGIYWRTWTFLLVLTVSMFILDGLSMPRTPFVLLMVTAMLVKATLIAGIFMHLRQESLDLVIGVGMTILGLGGILYALIVIDAWRIFQM